MGKEPIKKGILNLIIDGNNFVYRAGSVTQEKNHRGQDVGVISVAMKMLRKLIYDHEPDRMYIVWDGGISDWRRGVYPEYKLRVEGPQRKDIYNQAQVFRDDVLPHLPVLQWFKPGFEADDLIAAAVRVLFDDGERVIAVSLDQDFFQLLNHCDLLNSTSGIPFTQHDFIRMYGFDPVFWPEYRALVGDKSDGIEGIKGIGPKRAKEIIVEYKGSLSRFARSNPNLPVGMAVCQSVVRFEANVGLISLYDSPNAEALREEFSSDIRQQRAVLCEKNVRQFFMSNGFMSVLRSYQYLMGPFRRMATQTTR